MYKKITFYFAHIFTACLDIWKVKNSLRWVWHEYQSRTSRASRSSLLDRLCHIKTEPDCLWCTRFRVNAVLWSCLNLQDALRLCCCTFYFCFLLCSAAVTQFLPEGSINIIFSLYQHPQTQRMCRNLSRWQMRRKANMDNIDLLFLFLVLSSSYFIFYTF